MKIGEARGIYSTQLKAYNEQKFKLAQQKKQLQEKIKHTENGSVIYANEAATLEITYEAVSQKQEEYQKYMDQLMGQWEAEFNRVNAEQQKESAKEYGEEMGKILTVARRIMDGDIVPPSDEKKLLEYSPELYQMAKNIGMLKQLEEREEHDSLWEDEEPRQSVDAMEVADGKEAFAGGPKVVSVEDTMTAAAESVNISEC